MKNGINTLSNMTIVDIISPLSLNDIDGSLQQNPVLTCGKTPNSTDNKQMTTESILEKKLFVIN